MSTILFIACAALGQVQKTAPAPPPESVSAPAIDKEAERRTRESFIWSGVLSRGQALRKGVFHARGRKTTVERESGRVEGEVRIFCAFDFDEGKFRFDRFEPFVELLPEAKPGTPNWKKVTRDSRFIRVPGKCIIHLRGTGRTHIEAETAVVPYAVHPFDIRALGILSYYNLFNDKLETIDDLINIWMKTPPAEQAAEGPVLHRITWIQGRGSPLEYQNSFWVDESKGFAPVRYELRKRIAKPEAQRWSEPLASAATTWANEAGSWVPKTWHVEDSQVPQTGGSYDLAFDWESVNQPVPGRHFTVEGLGLDKGEMLVDMRLKQPIVIGTIGDDHSLIVGVEGGGPPMPAPLGGTYSTRARWRSVGLACLLLVPVGAYVVFRMMSRRRAE